MPQTLHHRGRSRSITTPPCVEVGVSRRLEALAVAGWPRYYLAAALRVSRAQLNRLYLGASCSPEVRDRLAGLYERLRRMEPPDSSEARGVRGDAAYRGWSAAEAWPAGSIDDPAARPITAHLLALAEDVAWMAATGESLLGVCRRLQLARNSLYRELERAGRLDLWRSISSAAA